MKNREKTLAIVVAILLVAMGTKSLYFDPFKPQTAEEEKLMIEMISIIDEKHDNILYRTGFFTTRVIAVKETEEVLKGHYRKYALWLFPFGDEYYDASDD